MSHSIQNVKGSAAKENGRPQIAGGGMWKDKKRSINRWMATKGTMKGGRKNATLSWTEPEAGALGVVFSGS